VRFAPSCNTSGDAIWCDEYAPNAE
jgi:hypothetical protein